MTPICQLLHGPRAEAAVVARRWDRAAHADRLIRWEEFRGHVAGLRRRLAGEPEGAWVLLTEDAYAFAVGLFALWHSGRHAVSPPNRQPGTLRVLQTRAAGVLSDRPDWLPEGSSIAPVIEGSGGDPSSLPPLDPDALAVELYTSGTTGSEKPVTKRIRHLQDEVRELGAIWDPLVGDATVFATASHQHLYGLLFGVLWPLAAGRAFRAHHVLHLGELVPRMCEVGDCVLASVPTYLKRLVRHSSASALRGRCRAVFSSGGLLSRETAGAVTRALGRSPIEILGSTETGGIAWRVQEPGAGESLWTPLPPVRVTRDPELGVARVLSPFVSVDAGAEGFATGDRISLSPDARFRLEGRSDRIAKVGEKRLDLARMESQLRGHALVDEVALATVDRDSEPRVAAAVVPSEWGREVIRQQGRQAFRQGLREGLADVWDPVLHPRYWRIVRALPENAQGKVTAAAVGELFRSSSPTASDRPEILEEFRGSDFLERACLVPSDLACLPGHFPGMPLVPGVLQLDWVMELVAELLEAPPRVEEIESAKFLAPLHPGHRINIHAAVSGASRVDFRIWSDAAEHTKGRVRVRAEREGA